MPATLNFPIPVAAGSGWNTLPLGAGGLVVGMHIANDGRMVCRTDVGNIYRWTGTTADYADPTKKWVPLMTHVSLSGALGGGVANRGSNDNGAWDMVQAPGDSNVIVAVFPDMSGSVYGTRIWYSTNAATTWNLTNIAIANETAQGNNGTKTDNYKLAVDPVNPNVAYCGMPAASGKSAGVYTTLTKSGGASSLATWTPVLISGSTPIPNTTYGVACGVVIDPSMGTTTVNSQLVTKHIILPVGGVGVYESTDGGVSFTLMTPFGTNVFYIVSAGCNYDGVYYCVVAQPGVNVSAAAAWTTSTNTITMGTNPGVAAGMLVYNNTTSQSVGTVLTYIGTTLTLTANASSASSGTADFLSFTRPTATDPRGVWRYVPGSPGTWTNITAGSYSPASFGSTVFVCVDPRNLTASKSYLAVFGPQGISAGFSTTNANTGSPVTWTGYTGGHTAYLRAASYDIGYVNQLFGQGISAFTYAIGAFIDAAGRCWWGGNQSLFYLGTSSTDPTPRTTGGMSYPNVAGNFYSWSMGRGQESTVTVDMLCPPGGTYPVLGLHDIGAPVRGTFTSYPLAVATPGLRYVSSNLEYAADDPSFIVSRTTHQNDNVDASCYSTNYGADGTWTPLANYPTSLYAGVAADAHQAGMIVAADKDHWIVIPNGFAAPMRPAYTTNARGAATWAFCGGLPTADWFSEPWFFGTYTPKVLAVGYGSDLGTVWACLKNVGPTPATLYRSTDYGQTFSTVLTWTAGDNSFSCYCLSVPGFPNELWVTSRYSAGGGAGLWHITNARTGTPPTATPVNLPTLATCPTAFTLGAPAAGGGYPTLYLLGGTGFGSIQYLYLGTYSGSGATVTWTLFGTSGQPNGINPDLPISCQLAGIQSIRGDWNVYQRLYVSSQGSGFAYYTPTTTTTIEGSLTDDDGADLIDDDGANLTEA
jgi:hypothetical protein